MALRKSSKIEWSFRGVAAGRWGLKVPRGNSEGHVAVVYWQHWEERSHVEPAPKDRTEKLWVVVVFLNRSSRHLERRSHFILYAL
jgi:hypothetical protein